MGSQNAHDHIIPVEHTITRPHHVSLCPLHHPAVVVEAVTLLTPVAEGRGGLAERTRPHHPCRPHDHTTTSCQSMSTTSSSRSGRGGHPAHTSGGGAGWARRTHTTTSSLSNTRSHDHIMSVYVHYIIQP